MTYLVRACVALMMVMCLQHLVLAEDPKAPWAFDDWDGKGVGGVSLRGRLEFGIQGFWHDPKESSSLKYDKWYYRSDLLAELTIRFERRRERGAVTSGLAFPIDLTFFAIGAYDRFDQSLLNFPELSLREIGARVCFHFTPQFYLGMSGGYTLYKEDDNVTLKDLRHDQFRWSVDFGFALGSDVSLRASVGYPQTWVRADFVVGRGSANTYEWSLFAEANSLGDWPLTEQLFRITQSGVTADFKFWRFQLLGGIAFAPIKQLFFELYAGFEDQSFDRVSGAAILDPRDVNGVIFGFRAGVRW